MRGRRLAILTAEEHDTLAHDLARLECAIMRIAATVRHAYGPAAAKHAVSAIHQIHRLRQDLGGGFGFDFEPEARGVSTSPAHRRGVGLTLDEHFALGLAIRRVAQSICPAYRRADGVTPIHPGTYRERNSLPSRVGAVLGAAACDRGLRAHRDTHLLACLLDTEFRAEHPREYVSRTYDIDTEVPAAATTDDRPVCPPRLTLHCGGRG